MATAAEQAVYAGMIMFILVIVTFIISMIVILMQYRRITYVIRYVRGNRDHIQLTKAKIVKTEYGEAWKLKYKGKLVPVPPDDAIDIDNKGRLHVEAFFSESGAITYIKTADRKLIPIHTSLVAQKMLYAAEVKKAQERGTTFLQKYGGVIVVGGIVIVLFAVVFIFWSDIINPAMQFQSMQMEFIETVNEILEKQQALLEGKQVVKPATPPN